VGSDGNGEKTVTLYNEQPAQHGRQRGVGDGDGWDGVALHEGGHTNRGILQHFNNVVFGVVDDETGNASAHRCVSHATVRLGRRRKLRRVAEKRRHGVYGVGGSEGETVVVVEGLAVAVESSTLSCLPCEKKGFVCSHVCIFVQFSDFFSNSDA